MDAVRGQMEHWKSFVAERWVPFRVALLNPSVLWNRHGSLSLSTSARNLAFPLHLDSTQAQNRRRILPPPDFTPSGEWREMTPNALKPTDVAILWGFHKPVPSHPSTAPTKVSNSEIGPKVWRIGRPGPMYGEIAKALTGNSAFGATDFSI